MSLLAAAAFGAAATLLLLGNPERRMAALAHVERVAQLAGMGLQQASVTGHRFTADDDIFDALDLDGARTLLSFDAKAAQARIERLPWIERASIERVVPDRVEVHVAERVPFAIWNAGGRHLLIDRNGRVLQPVAAGAMPELPRVAGDGAASEVAALAVVLAAHPDIARRVELAERVGERRWTLRLAGGPAIHLPADGEAGALARLAPLVNAGLAGMSAIDVRAATRLLARERRDGGGKVEGHADAGAGWPHLTTR